MDRDVDPLVGQLRKDKEEFEERLRKMEAKIQQAEAEAEAAKAQQGGAAQQTKIPEIDLEPADLPDLPDPLPEEIPALDSAWHVLSLARWSPLAKALTCNVIGLSLDRMKILLGAQWGKVYPSQDPGEDELLNPAILLLLDSALNGIGEKLQGRPSEERKVSREEAKTALEATPKRHRAA